MLGWIEDLRFLKVVSTHPSDVVNQERVLESYGVLSEELVAALHSKVPSIFDATPESRIRPVSDVA